MKQVPAEIYEQLIQIYNEVQEDMKNRPEEMKDIQTTEDFFTWRENIKTIHQGNSKIRNQIVENAIRGNASLELIYNWTKFYRMYHKAKANITSLKEKLIQNHIYTEEALNNVTIKSQSPLNAFLKKRNKCNVENLFYMFHVGQFGYRYHEFRSFNTAYEFTKIITHEEEYGPLSLDILVCYLRAFAVSGADLLECGREVWNDAENLCKSLLDGTYMEKQSEEAKQKKLI